MPDQDVSTRKSDERWEVRERDVCVEPNIERRYGIFVEGAAAIPYRPITWGVERPEDAHRIVAEHNACRGLSADQVAAIPARLRDFRQLSEDLAVIAHLPATEVCSIPAKMAAFEAMREALRMVIQQYTGDMADFVPEVCTALKQADDCEATP